MSRQQISDLKARYFRLLDTQQWAELQRLFAPGAVFTSRGCSHTGGPAIVAYIRQALGGARTVHHGHTPEISVDGDGATGVWAMADLIERPGHGWLRGSGHYLDEYVRSGSRWLIAASDLQRLHPFIEFGDENAAAQREIETVMRRYSHSIDYGHEEQWVQCFTEDGVFLRRDAITRETSISGAGAAGLRAFISAHSRAPAVFHKHMLTSPLITVTGERASSESYFVLLVEDDGAPRIGTFGRYLDQWRYDRARGWRIEQRIYEAEAWNPLWSEIRRRGNAAAPTRTQPIIIPADAPRGGKHDE